MALKLIGSGTPFRFPAKRVTDRGRGILVNPFIARIFVTDDKAPLARGMH